MTRKEAERLKAEFYKHRERFEDGYKSWCEVIDSMIEPDELKVGDWVFVDKPVSISNPHNQCAGVIVENTSDISLVLSYKIKFDDGETIHYDRNDLIKIPAPKFEVGQRYKHPLYDIITIIKREWSNSTNVWEYCAIE